MGHDLPYYSHLDDPSKKQTLEGMRQYIRDKLPQINKAIEAGELRLDTLIFIASWWAVELQGNFISYNLTPQEAQAYIQPLGFLVSSIEKHSQQKGKPPGAGIAQVPGLQDVLEILSQIAECPPRDTIYTFWLGNKGNNRTNPLTFTENPGEILFNRAVNETNRLNTISSDALRQICNGNLSIRKAEAIAALDYSTQNTSAVLTEYRSLSKGMEPKFFATGYRTYLPTYPIKGVFWGGPNAANIPSQAQLDYLIGTVNSDYARTMEGRWRYLSADDQATLQADMALPSLTARLLEDLGLTSTEVEQMDLDALRKLMVQRPELQPALFSFEQLIKATNELTAFHWGLIQSHLVKPSTQLTPEEKAQLPVKPDSGTGGNSHQHTKNIMFMRLKHPVASKLAKAILRLMHSVRP